jgi:hypothetical protein
MVIAQIIGAENKKESCKETKDADETGIGSLPGGIDGRSCRLRTQNG